VPPRVAVGEVVVATLTVLRTGPLALVQDLGRPGLAHLGVPPSGAADRPALLLANALVGNRESAAGIEAVLGGLALRADGPCVVAVTGATAPVRVGSDEAPFATAIELSDGDELRIGTPRHGLRCYLAVFGGIAVPAELGSRSTDVLSTLGPSPLTTDIRLPVGVTRSSTALPDSRHTPTYDNGSAGGGSSANEGSTGDSGSAGGGRSAGGGDSSADGSGSAVELRVLLGPRDGWFDDAAAQLEAGEWTVAPSSNRIGVRLDGTRLRRTARHEDRELPTEPVVTGSIQVPPSGHPVIFLNDHPTTGGYPVIAVVHPDALPGLAQARPGRGVRLWTCTETPNSST
jgi:allophanate hydrolase subunit 2